MILPDPTPSYRVNYNPNERSYEVVDVLGAGINRIINRAYPDDSGGFRGLIIFGSISGTSTIFTNLIEGLTGSIPVNDASAERRNQQAFTFRTLRVRNTTTFTPFNLTSITINGVEIMAAPVAITDNVSFFNVPLLESEYVVPNNSLWLSVDDSMVSTDMEVQTTD